MSDFNILRPDVVWVKDRCYRKLPVRKVEINPEEIEHDSYASYQTTTTYDDDDDDFSNFDIKHEGSRFWTTLSIPAALFGSIVGKKGMVINRIKNETQTDVNIPRTDMNSAQIKTGAGKDIAITGKDKRGVGIACSKITAIAAGARWRQDFTHFISFPLNCETLKDSFVNFKNEVLLHSHEIRGFHQNLFQNPAKLHLTVTTLILLDDREREKAAAALHKFKDDVRAILRGEPLVVSIRGIEYMNDDPSEVNVLYAKVQDSDGDARLQILADNLMNKFAETGLSKKQNDRVKLHITLMNTTFRNEKRPVSSEDDSSPRRETFDASFLLKKYSDFDFGTVTLSDVHLSVLYTSAQDGYYASSAVLKLPT